MDQLISLGTRYLCLKNKTFQRKGIFGFKRIQFKVQFELEFQIGVTYGKQLV